MPYERCGAVWKINVPESPGKYAVAYVYDHEHGGSQKKSLLAARALRDELAATMPFPITALLTQYRDGTFATEFRFEPDRKSGAAWSATYLKLDETTLRPKKATVSRNVNAYGYEGARAELERVWRETILQVAKQIDRLVRKGVPVHHHGPATGEAVAPIGRPRKRPAPTILTGKRPRRLRPSAPEGDGAGVNPPPG